MTSLIAARVVDGRRWALLNDTLSTYAADGAAERRTVSADELPALLRDTFGIALPHDPGLAAVYQRFAPRA